MSAGSSLPYRLRPNKAVDRELFLSLLTRLAPKLSLEKYHYVGLGGPSLRISGWSMLDWVSLR